MYIKELYYSISFFPEKWLLPKYTFEGLAILSFTKDFLLEINFKGLWLCIDV